VALTQDYMHPRQAEDGHHLHLPHEERQNDWINDEDYAKDTQRHYL
jgi:hypothetical protein